MAGISPLFSIYILKNYLSLTKISPILKTLVDKKALGPSPSPSNSSFNHSSEQEILQNAELQYFNADLGLKITVIVISEFGHIDPDIG